MMGWRPDHLAHPLPHALQALLAVLLRLLATLARGVGLLLLPRYRLCWPVSPEPEVEVASVLPKNALAAAFGVEATFLLALLAALVEAAASCAFPYGKELSAQLAELHGFHGR